MSPRPSQEGSWEGSWAVLGGSWAVLGLSLEGLEGLLGRLEGVFGLLLGALGLSWNSVGGPRGYQRIVLGRFGIRFADSINRFDLFMRFVDSIRSLDRSTVLHHVANTYRLNMSARRSARSD